MHNKIKSCQQFGVGFSLFAQFPAWQILLFASECEPLAWVCGVCVVWVCGVCAAGSDKSFSVICACRHFDRRRHMRVAPRTQSSKAPIIFLWVSVDSLCCHRFLSAQLAAKFLINLRHFRCFSIFWLVFCRLAGERNPPKTFISIFPPCRTGSATWERKIAAATVLYKFVSVSSAATGEERWQLSVELALELKPKNIDSYRTSHANQVGRGAVVRYVYRCPLTKLENVCLFRL